MLKGAITLKNRINHKKPITSKILDIIYWNEMIANTRYEQASNIGYHPNKEAVVQHSSGTSKGMPKSIPLTNENVNSFVEKHIPTVFSTFPYGTKMLNIL